MRFEYATTEGALRIRHSSGGYQINARPTPYSPSDDGWELKSSVVHQDRVLWFWRRKVEAK